ncbi:MAG: DNA polymerase IV, partial [Aurantimicrobium sp.]
MDAFFASVEVLDRPEVRGKPAVVAHDSPRSVVTSATYEARALGIRSAMPLTNAKRLVPNVIVLEPHFEKYRHYSRLVMKVFNDFTPLVEQLSIDEAFLDVSGAIKIF